jgi:hypothetical protein
VHQYKRGPDTLDPDGDRPTVARLDVPALGHASDFVPSHSARQLQLFECGRGRLQARQATEGAGRRLIRRLSAGQLARQGSRTGAKRPAARRGHAKRATQALDQRQPVRG